LWNPNPPINPNPPSNPNPLSNAGPPQGSSLNLTEKIYDKVSIGDVGYLLQDGTFMRLFNVMLPYDHPSNRRLGDPVPYKPLNFGPFVNTFRTNFQKVEHCSPPVSSDPNDSNVHARDPDQ
jgi:hypothetical protein